MFTSACFRLESTSNMPHSTSSNTSIRSYVADFLIADASWYTRFSSRFTLNCFSSFVSGLSLYGIAFAKIPSGVTEISMIFTRKFV